MTIDWSKPIEAVHEDGTVSPVSLYNHREWPDADGDWQVRGVGKGQWSYFRADGTHADERCPWRIRNVPEHPTPTQYAPELVELMVKTIRILADCEPCGDNDAERKLIAVARSIVSDLPQEVDPDEVEARRVAEECGWAPAVIEASLAGLKAALSRGRQLQRGEAA